MAVSDYSTDKDENHVIDGVQIGPSGWSIVHAIRSLMASLFSFSRERDGRVYLSSYSPAGDGVTDDTTIWQTALDAAAGKTLIAEAGKTYLVYGLKVSADTTIDFNDTTMKKRPATGSDSDNLRDWTGGTTFNTSGVYRPMFFLQGDATFKNGTLDGDRASETIALGATGGSAAGRGDRNLILGDEDTVAFDRVHCFNMKFKNALGYGIALQGCSDWRMESCEESGGYGPFFTVNNTVGAESGTFFLLDSKIGTNSVRSNTNVPNDFVLTDFGLASIQGNRIDGSSKVASTVVPANTPDGFKLQSTLVANITNNEFIDTGIKHAAGAGFAGDTMIVTGNSFLVATGFTGKGGITGGGFSVYNQVIVDGNIFQNCHCVVERAPGGINISDNTVRILEQMDGGDLWEWFGLVDNTTGGAGEVMLDNNRIDMGGFAGHVAIRETHPFGKMKCRGGYITGCDHVWNNSASGTHDSDKIVFDGVDLSGNRSLGRFRFNSIDTVMFRNCVIHDMDATVPTDLGISSYYTGRGSFHLGSAGAWKNLHLIGNEFLDATNDFKWELEGSTTITNFLVERNIWLSDEGSLSFDGNTVTATITYLRCVDNLFANTVQWSTNFTVTTYRARNNDFQAGAFTNDPSGAAAIAMTGGLAASAGAATGNYLEFDQDGTTVKVALLADS